MLDSRVHLNDCSKPLIFLGTSLSMDKLSDICDLVGIQVSGIIDDDYWLGTTHFSNMPVIDTERSFGKASKVSYYRDNFNFFCAVNWMPTQDAVTVRNREKRKRLIDLIDTLGLPCISIADTLTRISPSATIGHGVFIDAMSVIEPRAHIADYANINALTLIGHDAQIGRNCVIQRQCHISGGSHICEDSYFATGVHALKNDSVYGKNTFIHQGIKIWRGTKENEIVSLPRKLLVEQNRISY
jgi:acetyltransferase-like isoleucine patch superfamily enzyme